MKQKNSRELKDKDVIALLDVYLKEWMHRDQLMWTQLFRYFYASLIVIVLPNIPKVSTFYILSVPVSLFHWLGFFMSVAFLYISLAFAKRVEAVGNTYRKIYENLDSKYHRDKLKDLPFCDKCINKCLIIKYLNERLDRRLGYIVPILMFILLIVTNVILISCG